MQFMPATWRAYGLGGNIRDPGDAILGAANYLRASGAPRNYRRALYAYNHSRLYVEAVARYSRFIARDPHSLLRAALVALLLRQRPDLPPPDRAGPAQPLCRLRPGGPSRPAG